MLSGREQSFRFASASTKITPPTFFQHGPAHSTSEQALKLARFAYVRAQGNNPASLTKSGLEGVTIIQTVSKAIERAFKDEQFSRLTFDQQEIAAAHLTNQCIAGLRVVQALQGAMMNPYTMATQLKNNALRPQDRHNVFDHIISAHRPTSQVSHIASHEIDSLPTGHA